MNISVRINRVIGQLKGIKRMVDTERDCIDILQQISAVKKAINGLSKEIIVSDICQYTPKKEKEKIKKMMERVVNL